MITREGAGWQTVIADLSLILFMVTALALEDSAAKPAGPIETATAETENTPLVGEAMGIFRPGTGTGLAEWLAAQAPDPRQQITIVAQHRAGEASEAAQQAITLASAAERQGWKPRIVIEQAPEADLYAVLAHDLARGLQADGPISEVLED